MNLFWNYGEAGAKFSAALAAAGTLFTMMFGGWDKLLWLLCGFMALDFLLGVLAAAKAGRVDSKVMLWGGVNKLLVLAFVAVGNGLDRALPIQEPFVRTAVIWFYVGREGLSCVENYAKLGGRVPGFVKAMLAQLQEKGDGGKDGEGGGNG